MIPQSRKHTLDTNSPSRSSNSISAEPASSSRDATASPTGLTTPTNARHGITSPSYLTRDTPSRSQRQPLRNWSRYTVQFVGLFARTWKVDQVSIEWRRRIMEMAACVLRLPGQRQLGKTCLLKIQKLMASLMMRRGIAIGIK